MKAIKHNWGKNVTFSHSEIQYPSTVEEIQQIVFKSIENNKKIRTIGSGHSFSKLCVTDDILVSLDNYQGLIAIDKENCIAKVKGGTKLKNLGEILFKEGLAMENLGDIDSQSIAGTISTGTHGTGVQFGTISTQVIALKFINGVGEIVSCSITENPELFKSVQVSLGVFGIITEVTLQCIPAYKLIIQNRKEKISDVLSTIDQRIGENRNFEFYWIPYTDTAWTKSSNVIADGDLEKDNLINYLSELLVENYTFIGLCEMAKNFPKLNKTVAKIIAASVPTLDKINYSHKVYATLRMVKFTEMEYNVPAETFNDVLKDIKALINRKKYNVHFPIENRWVKKDDIHLSPAYGRDSAYIACHMYHKKDSTKYFKDLEEVFRAYDGRPHWGKGNTLKTKDVEEMYPMFSVFSKHRIQHDPHNIFMSKYMQSLIG